MTERETLLHGGSHAGSARSKFGEKRSGGKIAGLVGTGSTAFEQFLGRAFSFVEENFLIVTLSGKK